MPIPVIVAADIRKQSFWSLAQVDLVVDCSIVEEYDLVLVIGTHTEHEEAVGMLCAEVELEGGSVAHVQS